MSTIEERLERDIAAVTGGVVVTESDLEEARDAVAERVEIGGERSRRRTVAGLIAAAVVIPIVGVAIAKAQEADRSAPAISPSEPSPTQTGADLWLAGEAPTADLVQGVWREDNGTVSVRFSPSGSFSSDANGRVFGSPDFTGTYEVAGHLITLHVDGGTPGCAGETFVMRASIVEKGLMHFNPTQPGSDDCWLVRPQFGAWEQMAPGGDPMAGITVANKGWHPVTGARELYGLWMAEGLGYVLELDRNGSYYVADGTGDPIDQGEWTMRGSDLTLASSADSASCSKGDQLVWRGLEMVDDHPNLRATAKANPCGVPWASKAWIWVPDVRR
jgi:hypothetical protein